MRTRSFAVPPLVVLLVLAAVLLGGRTAGAAAPGYQQTNLVSNLPGGAQVTDPSLRNPWGLATSSTGPWWVSDNNAGVSTLYAGNGFKVPLTVTVPPPGRSPAGTQSTPTGVVVNGNLHEFLVPGLHTPASFIFDTEDGTISAWNPLGLTHAVPAVDNSQSGAAYKGLAIAGSSAGDRLYATNFGQHRVDVFSTSFAPVTLPAGAFTDPSIPSDFSPFGIENIGGLLYVTYAMPNGSGDEVTGTGLGFIDVFSPDGNLVRHFAQRGMLDAPWGMAVAPSDFGQFSGDLLVGNFGDGHINAFSPGSGQFLGQLGSAGGPVTIDGLWALAFGQGLLSGPTNWLYFTAGPNDQADGLFGALTAS